MRVLKKLPPPKKTDFKKDFFVIDIETKNGLSPKPDNFVFAVLYGHNCMVVLRTVDECYKEISKRKYRNKKIFAHNGEFDFSGIFGNIILNVDNSAIFNGKFISAKYNNVTLCDSMNILPTSVKKLGDLLGLPKLDISHEFLEGENTKVTPQMIEYCIRDCEIVYKSLLNAFEMVGGVRITLASLSMFYFRKDFLKDDIAYNDLNNEFFDTYFGGRTEAFTIGKLDARVYDINSLYPYIMSKIDFPDVKNLKKYELPTIEYTQRQIRKKEGMFVGKIHHKSTYFGYLPYKDVKSNKLLFPIGVYNVKCNFNELRFAIDSGIVEILEVKYIIFSSPIKSPFKDFVFSLYQKRLKTDNEFLKYYYKLLMNSLYGRFGMRKKYTTTYYDQIPYTDIMYIKSKFEYYELKLFSEKRNDCYLVTENKKADKMFFSIPSIASYITSAARIQVLQGLLANQEHSAYCDTDSIFVTNEPKGIQIGEALGEWKLEEKQITEVRGLKNYSYINNGVETKVIKGVNLRSKEIFPFVFEIEKYYKTKESIRRQEETGNKYIQRKTITNKYEKRNIEKNGETSAIIINN